MLTLASPTLIPLGQPTSPLARFAIYRGGRMVGEAMARDAALALGQYVWRNQVPAEGLTAKPWPTTDDLPPAA